MTERSRFCSVLFSVVFLFFCAISADAAYRPMDAIPQARTDAFYVVVELQDLKEMTNRLSYSFAVNRSFAEMGSFFALSFFMSSVIGALLGAVSVKFLLKRLRGQMNKTDVVAALRRK